MPKKSFLQRLSCHTFIVGEHTGEYGISYNADEPWYPCFDLAQWERSRSSFAKTHVDERDIAKLFISATHGITQNIDKAYQGGLGFYIMLPGDVLQRFLENYATARGNVFYLNTAKSSYFGLLGSKCHKRARRTWWRNRFVKAHPPQ